MTEKKAKEMGKRASSLLKPAMVIRRAHQIEKFYGTRASMAYLDGAKVKIRTA